MKVRRVHFVHQSFGDYVSGLVSGLDAIGIEVVVTTIRSGEARLSAPDLPTGVEHRSVTLPRFRDPRSPIGAIREVRELLDVPADVVHWQATGSPWVDLAFGATIGRRPSVVTVHDMQAHPGDRSVLPGTFAAIERLVNRADHVTVHAPHVKAQVTATGVEPDRVSVVAHGELATGYLPIDRLPLPPVIGRRSVLFFGRAQGYKGLEVLWRAMELLDRREAGIGLVIAGTGPSLDELSPPDREPPRWCRVIRGHVPREGVADLFDEAAVVALPYLEASQSGVAALAAGFGRPVVASRVPGLSDIVIEGQTGLLVTPDRPDELADAIAAVVDDADLARRLSEGASRHAADELSWTKIAKRLHEIYRRAEARADDRAATGRSSRPRPTGGTLAAGRELAESYGRGSERTVLTLVPGLEGGVDEATSYLLPDGQVSDDWRSVLCITKGMEPAKAPLVLARAGARMASMRARGQVDIVHLNMSSRGSTLRKMTMAGLARSLGLPYVIQLHAGGFESFYDGLPEPGRRLTRRLFAEAGHVFVLGEVFRRLLIDRLDVDPERVSILRNAVPVPPLRGRGPRLEPGADDGTTEPVRMLFTGRIGESKGVWDLLDALGRLRKLPWSIVIAGDGEGDEARRRAAGSGLDDRVEIRGWQSRDEIDRLLSEADVFILPSRREALSVALLEAMAGGLCCIATPVGAQGELLVEGDNALVFTPADVDGLTKAIELAVTVPELRVRLGRSARRTVTSEFTIDITRDRLLSTYERVLR